MTFLIFKFYDHHRSTRRLLHNHFIFVIYSVWLIHTTITNISSSNAFIISSTTSSKSNIVRRNAPFDTTIMTTEKCYFHANGKTTDSKSIFYGQCMSMNGPDGCCLEGHYKPGICTNLGHICCIKPDPECNAMFTNKGITKSALRQYGHLFRKFNQDLTMKNNDQNSNENNHNGQQRAIRSNPKQFKYIYNTNFEIVEMPAHMQLDAVTFVVDALDRFNGDFDDAADYLCRMLDQKYEQPSPWSCTIGRDFGYSVDPLPGKYMLFYIGNDVRVMAFVSKNEN